MIECRKIFEENRTIYPGKIKISNNKIIFTFKEETITGVSIKHFIQFINAVHEKYCGVCIPIVIDFGKVKFLDKLTVIIFECICFSIINDYRQKVVLYYRVSSDIFTNGFNDSPVRYLGSGCNYSIQEFKDRFKFILFKNHFRKIIEYDENDIEYVSLFYTDIDNFLKAYIGDDSLRNEVGEVVAELVGNVGEHAKTDCLVDLDITDTDYGKINCEGKYYGINIVVLNFSNIMLGQQIKDKLNADNLSLSSRYHELKRAYSKHANFFSDFYSEADFYNMAAFQDRISGSVNKNLNGGKGLTKLIKSIEKRADTHNCYIISGKHVIRFIPELLDHDENNWVGFNHQTDFFSHPPDRSVIEECPVFIPGIAYNLNLAIKGDGTDE
jgi:hypothetical protein